MSSDWKDPNATWQPIDAHSWDKSADIHELSPLQSGQAQVATSIVDNSSNDEADQVSEADSLSDQSAFPPNFGFLQHLFQQIAPIILPILSGGLIFLISLPLILRHTGPLAGNALWPVALLFVAIALIQGTLLYYTGSNKVLWSFSVAGGILLFLLISCFAIFGLTGTAIFLAAIAIGGVLIARFSICTVSEGFVAIVYAFGKYSRTLLPGLNFLLPWEEIHIRLDTRETHWLCPEQRVSISRDQDVLLKANISYQLMQEDAHIVALQVNKWDDTLRELFIATIQTAAQTFTAEDFIPTAASSRPRQATNGETLEDNLRWDRVNSFLRRRMEDQVAQWGVQIHWVRIRDVAIVPHGFTLADTNPTVNTKTAEVKPKENEAKAPTPKTQEPASTNEPNTTDKIKYPPASATPSANASTVSQRLSKAYDHVRLGHIKDPATIRGIAKEFETIANNPNQSQIVDFDAERAAQNLYKQAKYYEDQAKAINSNQDDVTVSISANENRAADIQQQRTNTSRNDDPASGSQGRRIKKDENLRGGG